jgi:hypothetical protein
MLRSVPRKPPPSDPVPARFEDVLNKGIRAGVGALPIIGSPLTEFLAFVVGDPAQERRDDFMKVTLERLLALEEEFDRLDKDALRSNDQFHATFIQATRLSTQTASEEKRRLLQNAILNSAILSIEEDERQILMSALERITPLHASLLGLLDHPAQNEHVLFLVDHGSQANLLMVIEAAFPKLRSSTVLAERAIADLDLMGLTASAGRNFNVKMPVIELIDRRSTPFGQLLLQFIAEPLAKHSIT